MQKTEILVLSISLGTTLVLSTLFGFAGSAIIGTFWGWFWISFLFQFIGFFLYNSFLIQKERLIQQKFELETLEQLSKFSVRLNCAYCQQPNIAPIQLNQKNTFKCESCNQVNGVFMQFSATTLTTPIESVKIPVPQSESIEFKVTA